MTFDKLKSRDGKQEKTAGEHSQTWEIKKLGEIGKVSMCKRVFKEDTTPEGDIPFYKIGTFGKSPDAFITKEKYYEFRSKFSFPKKGDILISASGTIGRRVRYDGESAYFQDSNIVWIDNNEKQVLNDYLYRFYEICNWQSTKGATISRLYNDNLRQIEIPFPKSLPEQQRIVSILDEAFSAIERSRNNAEQNLKNAKELFESYLQGVFEKKGDCWEEKTLGQLCVFTQGIQRDVKLQSEKEGENQVRFLRIVDYTQGNEPPRYIDYPGDKYILNTDDVALVRYGASTGFVCRGLEGALANNLFRVIPKSTEKLTNDFLFIYLNSPIFQNVIKATMNGAAMPAISFGLIEEIPFPLPPLKAQQTIVRQLDALRAETQKLEAIYKQKINDLEELKKSILQKAFKGELAEPAGELRGGADTEQSQSAESKTENLEIL